MRLTPELVVANALKDGDAPADLGGAPSSDAASEAAPAATEVAVEASLPDERANRGSKRDGEVGKRRRHEGETREEKKEAGKRAGKSGGKQKARHLVERQSDLEVEVKLRCDALDCLTRAGLDVLELEPKHFEDNWVFKLPDGKLRKGQYLRVRYRGDGNGSGARREGVLTYKGKSKRTGDSQKGRNKGKKVREEIETTIGRPNQMVKILKRLGLKRSFRYQKFRSVHRVTLDDGATLTAMFDETPIGNFLELEGDSDRIERVASLLGYRPEDLLTESYVEMQLARCVARGESLRDMVFDRRQKQKVGNGAERVRRSKKKGRDPKQKAD